MGKLAWVVWLFVVAGSAEARQSAAPSGWDLGAMAGSLHGRSTDRYADSYHSPEWRLAAGHYWTPHLKTEIEFGASGEGNRYIQRFLTVPGSATSYPIGAQEFVRTRQGSAKVTWQFLDNQWVHPYLSAGMSFDEERTRTHIYAPISYPDPRNPSTRIVGPGEHDEAPRTTHRPGLVLGGGAKWYVSPRAFMKTGAQVGLMRRARSITVLAGMGFDF